MLVVMCHCVLGNALPSQAQLDHRQHHIGVTSWGLREPSKLLQLLYTVMQDKHAYL